MSEYSEEIQKWIKRNNRKQARLVSYVDGVYLIVYFDKGKVRIGTVKDGMYCRYGINCFGAMTSTDRLSLWQFVAGACSEEEVQVMIDYLKGESQLPAFDFGYIKRMRH